MELESKIEALLFVAGDEGISLEEMSGLLKEPTSVVFKAIERLKRHLLESELSALHILEAGNLFILTTKKEYADVIKDYAQSPLSNTLSQAALETLSIIAYKQPITRSEIDEIRGVQTSGAVQKLVVRQLIKEVGRVDGPGRAILYGTTDYFMNYFGLEDLADLPSISEMENEIEKELPTDLFFANFQEELGLGGLDETKNNDEITSLVEEIDD